jgi:hypothetical protein
MEVFQKWYLLPLVDHKCKCGRKPKFYLRHLMRSHQIPQDELLIELNKWMLATLQMTPSITESNDETLRKSSSNEIAYYWYPRKLRWYPALIQSFNTTHAIVHYLDYISHWQKIPLEKLKFFRNIPLPMNLNAHSWCKYFLDEPKENRLEYLKSGKEVFEKTVYHTGENCGYGQ